jgi:DHA1 family inner membrane transport protein
MAHVAARIVALRQARFAELALAIGAFAIGTGEFAAMGFLPSVADGLGVTIPEAGRSISAYALGVVVGALKEPQVWLKLGSAAVGFGACSRPESAARSRRTSFLLGLRFASGLPHGAYSASPRWLG